MIANKSTNRLFKSMRHQGGVALLTVVFIVSVLTVIVAYSMESQLLTVERVTNQAVFEQSYQLAMGGEQWAIALFQKDMEDEETAKTDHLGESWKDKDVKVKMDVGELTVDIEDLSGRLNLNSLFLDKAKLKKELSNNSNNPEPNSPNPNPNAGNTKKPAIPVHFTSGVWILNNLLLALEEDTRLVGNLIDWMDTDDSDQAVKDPKTKRPLYIGGAEDSHYTSLEKPYRAANQKLKTLGELRFVKGFNAEIIKKLSPYVTVLPTQELFININTAPKGLLIAMANEALQEPASLEEIMIGQSLPRGMNSIDIIAKRSAKNEWMPNIEQIVDVRSSFFRVTSQASFDELSYSMSSMLFRNFEKGENGQPKPARVVLRERKIL